MAVKLRVIELEYREGFDGDLAHVHSLQWREDQGPWTTVPVIQATDIRHYNRLQGGSDD